MKTTLTKDSARESIERLREKNRAFAMRYPGDSLRRQPVHTVYGGAHLFKAETARRLGDLAIKSLVEHAPDAAAFSTAFGMPRGLAEKIYPRVVEKLEREPVEDFRIDFEDGYGNRKDEEEDGHAESTAREIVRGMRENKLPPFIGIRIKSFTEEMRERSMRTLDVVLSEIVAAEKKLPQNFVITLPKVQIPEQVSALADVLEVLEHALGLKSGSIPIEIMIEQTQALFDANGQIALPKLVDASHGRCIAAHFGAYDYTASCDVTAAHQNMLHPACDFARNVMQVSLGGRGIWLSDGATNVMPIGERIAVCDAWKLHVSHTRHSLETGFYQGWDLHPAQLPARFAAVFAFFIEALPAATERLKNFVDKAAQATLVGSVFDDAATGQGLLNFFLRGINCGAVRDDEALATGLTLDEIRSRSFSKILIGRRK